jgi:hypothetical protein
VTTATTIDELIEKTMQDIAAAAAKRDISAVTAHTKKASELEEMKNTVLGIEERLKGLHAPQSSREAVPITGQTPKSVVQNGQKLRELPVEVTQGMINQNLLTLTAHVKRGRIRTGEELLVEAQPSGERFRTDLVVNGNKLRERGAIGRFYREAGVHDGEFVVLTETAPRRWTLRKAVAGEHLGRGEVISW